SGMLNFFKERGISDADARTCLGDTDAVEKLVNMTQAGATKGVTGTPTFYMNGEKLPANTWEAMEPLLVAATK
ncbi:MAG: thioredoxin domain-containing protein, partial [Novosphingopyxis baekryungensis]|nr:thioredoxin domain-containing protein [Novosphingopyxis baekryungensis]